MRHLRLLAAAALGAAMLLPAVPAHAAAPPGPGLLCGFATLTNPFAEPGRQTGELDGGPMLIADGADPRAGRITCTLRKNTGNHTGGTVLVSRSSLTTPGVVALPPTTVEYTADAWDFITICTQVEIVGGPTFYWDDAAEAWSTDPDVLCYDWFPEPEPIGAEADPYACPLLAEWFPPEGDVPSVWDCPPYGN